MEVGGLMGEEEEMREGRERVCVCAGEVEYKKIAVD